MFNPYCMATKPVLITQKLGRAEDKATGGWKRPLLYVPLRTGQQQQGLAPVLSSLQHEGEHGTHSYHLLRGRKEKVTHHKRKTTKTALQLPIQGNGRAPFSILVLPLTQIIEIYAPQYYLVWFSGMKYHEKFQVMTLNRRINLNM